MNGKMENKLNRPQQLDLMIRLDETIKYIANDITEIKATTKDFYNRVDSLENIIWQHKKYMEEHPKICDSISEIEKRLDKKDNIKDVINTVIVVLNGLILIYLTYLGIIK